MVPECCLKNKDDFMLGENILKNKVLDGGRDFL